MERFVKEEWVKEVDDELKRMRYISTTELEQQFWKRRSIYRLLASITDLNKKAYMPQVVSFGPYHHGEEHLQAMEDHKHRVLLRFLKRSNKSLKNYIDSLAPLVHDLMDSYDSLDPAWQRNPDAFLQLMILDGCFMLEILKVGIRCSLALEYPSNDPIFSDHAKLYIMPNIKRDILLLENQLPMMVLYSLLAVQNDKTQVQDLIRLLNYDIFDFLLEIERHSNFENCLHVLDMYRKILLFRQYPRRDGHWPQYTYSKRSATELYKAGIRFRDAKIGSLGDISFDRGVLTLPFVVVDDATESVFLNLLAFERFHIGAGTDITSYVFFMNIMINNAEDVTKLHSEGIIRYVIGSDQDVANLFSSLSKDTVLDPNSGLYDMLVRIENYCRLPWNQLRAILIYTYFRNLIRTTTVVTGIVIFALTAIQTVYTVYPFYRS